MEQNATNSKKIDVKILIAGALVIGLALGFLGGFMLKGGGDASIVSYLETLETKIASSIKGGKGPVVATIEGSEIYKGVFDRKYDLFVDNLPLEPDKKVQVKSNSKMLLQFLGGLVESEVLLKSLKDDTAFLTDPEFLVYLSLKTVQTVQEYYLVKKIEGKVDQNITKEQYDAAYNQLKADPRYAQALQRIPADKIQDELKKQILRQRQMAEVKVLSDKLKQGFRIKTFDDVLLGTGKGNK